MSRRRSSTWPRGGLNVRGRKNRAKLCLAKKNTNANANAVRTSLQKKLRELQGTVPGSQGMDIHTLLQSIENYILVLEAKVSILRCLSNLYGV